VKLVSKKQYNITWH